MSATVGKKIVRVDDEPSISFDAMLEKAVRQNIVKDAERRSGSAERVNTFDGHEVHREQQELTHFYSMNTPGTLDVKQAKRATSAEQGRAHGRGRPEGSNYTALIKEHSKNKAGLPPLGTTLQDPGSSKVSKVSSGLSEQEVDSLMIKSNSKSPGKKSVELWSKQSTVVTKTAFENVLLSGQKQPSPINYEVYPIYDEGELEEALKRAS